MTGVGFLLRPRDYCFKASYPKGWEAFLRKSPFRVVVFLENIVMLNITAYFCRHLAALNRKKMIISPACFSSLPLQVPTVEIKTFKKGEKNMFCDNCGTRIPGGFNFCPSCGAQAGAAVPPVPLRNMLSPPSPPRPGAQAASPSPPV